MIGRYRSLTDAEACWDERPYARFIFCDGDAYAVLAYWVGVEWERRYWPCRPVRRPRVYSMEDAA